MEWDMDPADIAPAERTLRALGVDKIDMYLNHWPWPNVHAPGAHTEERNPHAVPYIHEQFLEAWNELLKLKEAGKVVGTAPQTIREAKWRCCYEMSPIVSGRRESNGNASLFQQTELRRFYKSENIVCTGYMAVGSPYRPARDTFKEHRSD